MAKKPKKTQKKNKTAQKKEKEIESIFKNSTNLKQFKKHIKEADRYEIQRLRSIILEEKKKGTLETKLSWNDVSKIMELLEKKLEEPVELLKTNELRPLPFSKTVTIFDVYETDEENWTPYISPLATVGKIETTSSTDDTTSTDIASQGLDTSGLGIDGLTGGDEQTDEKKSGLFGLGLGGIL